MVCWSKSPPWILATLIVVCAAQEDDCETGPIVFPGATTSFIFPELNATCSGAMLKFRGGYFDPIFIPIEGLDHSCEDSLTYGAITLPGDLSPNREAKLTLLCDDWDEGPCMSISVGQQQSDALLDPVITLSCRAMGDQSHVSSSPSTFSPTVSTTTQPTAVSIIPPRTSTAPPDTPTDLSSGPFSGPPSSGITASSLPTMDPTTSGKPTYTCACAWEQRLDRLDYSF